MLYENFGFDGSRTAHLRLAGVTLVVGGMFVVGGTFVAGGMLVAGGTLVVVRMFVPVSVDCRLRAVCLVRAMSYEILRCRVKVGSAKYSEDEIRRMYFV